MLACTALSAASAGKPDVSTPSKNEPIEALLLSPPVPSTIAPSWCIGAYPLGSDRSQKVDRPPDCALPPLSSKVVCPLFFSTAVTKSLLLDVSFGLLPSPLTYWPFSMSASTQGPLPEHGEKPQYVVRLTASMCAAPLSRVLVSALPKSNQQPEFTWVPLATMYMPSGWPLTATPEVLLSR